MSETQAESTGPVEATEVDSEVGSAKAAGSAPAVTEADDSEDDPSTWTEKAQKAFNKLTRKNYEYASRAERAEFRAQEYERQLGEMRTASASAKTETVAPSDDYPTLESVGWDEDKHRQAVDAYYDKKLDAKAETVLSKKEEAAQREQSAKDWEQKQRTFTEKNPDYVQKVIETGRRGEWDCSPAMTQVIQRSDVGPEICLHLAENAAKSAQIARLPPAMAAFELGQIAAQIRVAKSAPPPVSKAPPPPVKIEAADSTGETDPSKMTDTQFAKWRRKQIAQRR